MYGILPMDPHGHCSEHLTPGLSFIGYYDNGQPKGPCWRQLVGGSWMYGILNENGEFTGAANMAYIYQDLELAMVGNYNKGLLVSIIFKTSCYISPFGVIFQNIVYIKKKLVQIIEI